MKHTAVTVTLYEKEVIGCIQVSQLIADRWKNLCSDTKNIVCNR